MKKIKIIFLLLGLISAFYVYCMYQVYSFSKLSSNEKSDVAIVLGAGTKNGDLSPIFRERVNHGITLIKNGNVDYLILTGGLSEGEKISDSKAAANYAQEMGVDSSKIFIEELSAYTYYNIQYAHEIMQVNGFQSALLVSDPYHLKRSIAMCNKAGITALPAPTPTSMFKSQKVKNKFLLKEALFYGTFILFRSW